MTQMAPPDPRSAALQRLNAYLNSVTVQDLRQGAAAWGWNVRGTAKADIVAHLVERLANSAGMVAAFKTLSLLHQRVLTWQAHLGRMEDPVEALRIVLNASEGHDAPKATVARVIAELRQRLLLFVDAYQGMVVPDIYFEWLPGVAAPLMGHPRALDVLRPALSAEDLDYHVEHLLAKIEAERPLTEAAATLPPPPANRMAWQGSQLRGAREIKAHPGILDDAILTRWGYSEPEDRDMARTLLSIMLAGGLCVIHSVGTDGRLSVHPHTFSLWRDLSPVARRANLLHWWTRGWAGPTPAPMQSALTWDELDLVIPALSDLVLRQTLDWTGRELLDGQLRMARAWLASLIGTFALDTWYSVPRLLNLIYEVRRDLLFTAYYASWHFYEGDMRLDARQMAPRAWLDTYGLLVEAWLSGPARWLGQIEVGYDERGERLVAFRRPSEVTTAPATLPADTLRFEPNGQLTLRNSWRVSGLRETIRKVAVEATRDREKTLYTPDAAIFRQTLRNGEMASQVMEAFAEAGFRVPQSLRNRLEEWQARMGRHQLYDNLAVIEFNDDLTLAELQATTGLGRAELYPISPRCVVVLRPDAIPGLVDELRRKGYSPQVNA